MKKKRGSVILFLLLHTFIVATAQSAHKTEAHDPNIKTLLIRNCDNWLLPPAIELGAGSQITVSFDNTADQPQFYNYSVIHCNADWIPSTLAESEYLDGFNNNPITESTPSFNTYEPYYHYRLTLPNDNINLKLSGNYIVRIFDPNQPEKSIATACFYVYEKLVEVLASITADTDISFRAEHQQVNIRILHPNFDIRTPQTDIKVVIEQNGRADTRKQINTPLYQRPSELIFEHNKELIFEGGNEYRRFETVSSKYPGLHVDNIRFDGNHYYASLLKDDARNNKQYQYDQDQNGRTVVRDVQASDNDTEADYFKVHFTLPTELPYINGRLYILGELSNNRIDPNFELLYNEQLRQYEKVLLLKQGSYNYLYAIISNQEGKTSLSPIEGSHWETENEYLTTVYHRPQGGRYDRLVGLSFIKSQQ